ncbi:hypothetical protein ACM66B_000757 [Microbotryomycetes sp. NB124-2]
MANALDETPPSPASSSSDVGFGDMMEEPADFRPSTPPPTVQTYSRRHYLPGYEQLEDVHVGLVSGHSLWGHILYPAAIAMSRFLELHADKLLRSRDVKGKGKAVIELGAGGGLPGLVAALEGADKTVITDFPDPALVNNIAKNIELNVQASMYKPKQAVAMGFTWGSPPTALFEAIRDKPNSTRKFDLILLSDLVFNHSQHGALLDTCESLLASREPTVEAEKSADARHKVPAADLSPLDLTTPAVLCFFSHHRPTETLIKADLGILALAKSRGWTVTRVWKDDAAGPAFPEDEGDLCIRSTVHGFAFTRP